MLILKSLKHLEPIASGAYRCDALEAAVFRVHSGWMISVLASRDASITLVPTLTNASIQEVDRFIGAVLETPVPHAKLRKASSGNWCYDPWGMVITVAEHNPGWGDTFKGSYLLANGHFKLHLNRLTNLRAFLKCLQEVQAAS